MTRFVAYWALAGLFIPLCILVTTQIENWVGDFFAWRLDLIAVIFWPSSLMLMALDAVHQPWWWAPFVYALSISINVILYSAIGSVLWLFWSLYSRYFKYS